MLTLHAVGIERLLVVALWEGDDAGRAPVPLAVLHPGHEVTHLVLLGGELVRVGPGVIVLAVHPVGVQAPAVLLEEGGHWKRAMASVAASPQ